MLITNTSGYRGVSLHQASGKYQAQIRDDTGRQLFLGNFSTPEDAAAAYAEAARKYHGEFMGALQ